MRTRVAAAPSSASSPLAAAARARSPVLRPVPGRTRASGRAHGAALAVNGQRRRRRQVAARRAVRATDHPPHARASAGSCCTPRELGGFELLDQSRTRIDGRRPRAPPPIGCGCRCSSWAATCSHRSPSSGGAAGAGVTRIDGPDMQAESSPPRRTPTSRAPARGHQGPTRRCRSAAGGCSGGCWGSLAVGTLGLVRSGAACARPARRRLAPAAPPPSLEERTREALDALERRGSARARATARASTSGSRSSSVGTSESGTASTRSSARAASCSARWSAAGALGGGQPGLQRLVDQVTWPATRGAVPVPACAGALAFARELVEATRPRLARGSHAARNRAEAAPG